MPQVLKDEVRERLLAAALRVFAERGYAGATMSAIAERAGLGAASTYRYYSGKRELFDALVTPRVAKELEELLERRVKGLAHAALGESGVQTFGEEMLRFWTARRLEVVILLDRAEGTPYADFGQRFVHALVAGALARLGEGRPRPRVSAAARFVLVRIFDNTRRALAAILEAHEDEDELREAIEAFWSYQIPGVEGFGRWLRSRAEHPRPVPPQEGQRRARAGARRDGDGDGDG